MTTIIPYVFTSDDHGSNDINIVRIVKINNKAKDLFFAIHFPHLGINAFYGDMVRQHIENNLIHHQNANPEMAFNYRLAIKASAYFFGLLDRSITCRSIALSSFSEAVLKDNPTDSFSTLESLLDLAEKAIDEIDAVDMPRDSNNIYLISAFLALTVNLALQNHVDSDLIDTMLNIEHRINPIIL